jgi:lipid-binding SYLF domain-containing protein
MRSIFLLAAALILIATVNPAQVCAKGMQDDIDQAVTVFKRFQAIPEQGIPPRVLRDAKGLAFLTVIKAGFVISGRGGTGVLVARTSKGWSGPSAIGTGGAGWGLQIGAQVTEFVIVLNTNDAVKAFSKEGNVQLGAGVSVAAGPVGRSVEAGVTPVAAVYTYSRSQGLFAGISLEGTVVATRSEANEAYYGHPVHPDDILSGKIPPPKGARKLQAVLEKY